MSETYLNEDAAERYDSARELPEETQNLLMDKLRTLVSLKSGSRAIDLGGGTGRFARLLQKAYQCPIITLDPSEAMLKQGINRRLDASYWIRGSAEHIPLRSSSIDLVWMSQVFHHLDNRALAFQEIMRVLQPEGHLIIRNGTRENDAEIEWYKCFPEARKLDEGRIPFQGEIISFACQQGFELLERQTIYQFFASSYTEYYAKISQRGLSSLISISDEAFSGGLKRLKEWTANKPPARVYEPVDLFIFRKSSLNP